MTIPLRLSIDLDDLVLGVVVARGVAVGWAPDELSAEIDALVARRAGTDFPPADHRKAVRDLFRAGGFKPTGRNKPASEYLARAADRGAFPRIDNVVDVINLHSLESGLPISLLDLDRALADGTALVVRHGFPGESFVFNQGGQVIDVGGLIIVARESGQALANGVKDSMGSKTTEATRNVLAVIYGTRAISDRQAMDACVAHLATRFATHCNAASTEVVVLPT